MSLTQRQLDTLRLLASMPLLDRVELAFVADWPDRTAYHTVGGLMSRGLVESVPHAAELVPHTRRCMIAEDGLRLLAEAEGVGMEDLLRLYPVSEQWRRLLLERLDAVGSIYRLTADVGVAAGLTGFRWYRAMPLDAGIVLADGRTLGIVRQGVATSRTAFAKRLWRLREATAPGALLLLAPDSVSQRHSADFLRGAPFRCFLALETDAATAGADHPVWHRPSMAGALDLHAVLDKVERRGALPVEGLPKRASLPTRLDLREPGPDYPDATATPLHLVPTALRPTEKRALDLIADWPWITGKDLGGLLGVTLPRVSFILSSLESLGLLARARFEGRRRLALSDRGLKLLARRDRASVGAALGRWSAAPLDPDAPVHWRNVSGSRARQLLRNVGHTESVHRFVAALSEQARSLGWTLNRLDPPRRASRYFRHEGRTRSVQPDAFGLLTRGQRSQPFFLEWERRAIHPSTMRTRLAPYLRYFSTRRPVDDHGAQPIALVVFDDPLAEARFLGVATKEMDGTGVEFPLWVSHRDALEAEGPLGAAWRSPHEMTPTAFFRV